MPVLARAKRKVASQLNSRAMHADSRQTDICAYLSAILLGGLLLNAIFGWWWADPIAALVMVPIIAREGRGLYDLHSLVHFQSARPPKRTVSFRYLAHGE